MIALTLWEQIGALVVAALFLVVACEGMRSREEDDAENDGEPGDS